VWRDCADDGGRARSRYCSRAKFDRGTPKGNEREANTVPLVISVGSQGNKQRKPLPSSTHHLANTTTCAKLWTELGQLRGRFEGQDHHHHPIRVASRSTHSNTQTTLPFPSSICMLRAASKIKNQTNFSGKFDLGSRPRYAKHLALPTDKIRTVSWH